ncbi:MAG: methyltransferase domain-containing protein [Cytophagales bacterium]
MNKDPLGVALMDYISGNRREFIKVTSSLGEEDNLWVKQFFRTYPEMPEVEKTALKHCKGKVLDVGAGAGAHSQYLKTKGLDVFPIDISEGAVKVMKAGGLDKARKINFFDLFSEKYDTILMLMNGIGITGTIDKLDVFFQKVTELLYDDGVLIFDSSDIIYMFEDEIGNFELDHDNYYGEVKYSMSYKNIKGDSFEWLFIDYNTFKSLAEKNNFHTKILSKQNNNAYTCMCSKVI